MSDMISRKAAIDAVRRTPYHDLIKENMVALLMNLPSEEPRWIPFKARELTEEEKQEHPECNFIFDGQLPEDGQRILVSIDVAGHERVQLDEFYEDDEIYLDSGYEIGEEAVAWMPLPNPYQEGSE